MSKKSKVIAWIFFLICFAAMIVYLGVAKNYLDSDISSELIVAKICSEENVLMTKNWYYATEIRLLNMNLPMTLLFEFTSDYTVVRVLASIVMLGLTASSFLYFCKQAGLKSGIFFAALLMLPFSDVIFEYEHKGLYYCIYIIVQFYSLGLAMAINTELSKFKKLIVWGLYLGIAFLMGATTIRELLTFYYPFVLACAILWLIDYVDTYGVKVISWSEIKQEIILKWRNNKFTCYLLTSIIGAFVSSVGYVFNVVILRDIYDFNSFDRTLYTNVDDFSRFSEVILGHARIFGYEAGCQFISVQGILNILILLFTGLLIWLTYGMVKNSKAYELKKQVIIMFFACAVLFNDFVFIFSDKCGDRYMIPYAYTFIAILCIFVERKDLHISIRRLFYVIVMGLFVVNSAARYTEAIVDEKDNARNIIAYVLNDKEYTFGYATFWNANVFTELTNGQVEIASVNLMDWDKLEVEPWMVKKSNIHRRTDDALFILLTDEEYEANSDLVIFSDKYLILDYEGYKIFEYYNSDELWTYVGSRVEAPAEETVE